MDLWAGPPFQTWCPVGIRVEASRVVPSYVLQIGPCAVRILRRFAQYMRPRPPFPVAQLFRWLFSTRPSHPELRWSSPELLGRGLALLLLFIEKMRQTTRTEVSWLTARLTHLGTSDGYVQRSLFDGAGVCLVSYFIACLQKRLTRYPQRNRPAQKDASRKQELLSKSNMQELAVRNLE